MALCIALLLVSTFSLAVQAQNTSTPSSSPTSSGSALPTPVANLSCPSSNGTVYLAASGVIYSIECDLDHAGGDIGVTSLSSLEQCIAACDTTIGCVDVALSDVACYLKGSVGSNITARGLLGASLLSVSSTSTPVLLSTVSPSSPFPTSTSLSCPGSNGTTYTAVSGAEFLVECGIDLAGGDMGMLYVSDQTGCIEACDSTAGCVDISLSGSACYLKSRIGTKTYNARIFGVRLVSGALVASTASPSIMSTSSIEIVTSASPTPTTLTCPASNNTIYYAPSGDAYAIECGIDHPGGDMRSSKALSLEERIATCDAYINCVYVSLSGVACYEKSVLTSAVHAAGILGARLLIQDTSTPPVTSSTSAAVPAMTTTGAAVGCPADNGTVFTTAGGQNFSIECSIDHPGGDLAALQLSGGRSTWFGQCIETCANTTGCLDVSLSGSACYLKSRLTPAHNNIGILGAKLIPPPPPQNTATPPPPTPFSPVRIGAFEYLACYNDSVTSRALSGAFMYGSQTLNMTVSTCVGFCADFTFFGVERAQECYCGNQLSNGTVEQVPSECEIACAGNATETCGRARSVSVYQLVAAENAIAAATKREMHVRKHLAGYKRGRHGRGLMNVGSWKG